MTARDQGFGPPLILASASPRRRALLGEAGIDFEVIVPDEPEPRPWQGEDCGAFALRAARAKAVWAASRHPGRTVLAADTVVVLDDEILGKPRDAEDAAHVLRRLSGRSHCVHTAVVLALVDSAGDVASEGRVQVSTVTFRELTDAEIGEYIASGEPADKAGAYGIQGLGGTLVAEYKGSYTNIVGLPMETVAEMLRATDHSEAEEPCFRLAGDWERTLQGQGGS